jgi:hypothetical protein
MQHETEYQCEGKKLVFYDVEGVSGRDFYTVAAVAVPSELNSCEMWEGYWGALEGVEEKCWWEYSVFPFPSL